MDRYVRQQCVTLGCTLMGESGGYYKGRKVYRRKCYKCRIQESPKLMLTKKYIAYKQSAEKRDISFEISKEELTDLVSRKCHFCGGGGFGIDRIDNNVGYIKDNCVPCCTICNKMKSDRDVDIFLNQCEKIYKFNNEHTLDF